MNMIDLTYSAVAAAAEALEQQGLEPSVRSVRDKLGGGSNTTVTPLLRKWKEARAARSGSRVQINPAIADLILAQIAEAAAEASNKAGARAKEAEEAFDELAKQMAEVEAQLNTSNASLAATQAQLLQHQGQLQERVREMDELRTLAAATVAEADQRAERERTQAEAVRQDLVRSSLRLERVPDLEAAVEEARQLLKASNDTVARAQQAEAVATSRAQAQHERASESAAREARLEAQLQRLQDEREKALAEERASQQEILRLSTIASALDARCAVQQAELERLRQAPEKNAGAPNSALPQNDQRRAA
jgi:colicin import membrane protein